MFVFYPVVPKASRALFSSVLKRSTQRLSWYYFRHREITPFNAGLNDAHPLERRFFSVPYCRVWIFCRGDYDSPIPRYVFFNFMSRKHAREGVCPPIFLHPRVGDFRVRSEYPAHAQVPFTCHQAPCTYHVAANALNASYAQQECQRHCA